MRKKGGVNNSEERGVNIVRKNGGVNIVRKNGGVNIVRKGEST